MNAEIVRELNMLIRVDGYMADHPLAPAVPLAATQVGRIQGDGEIVGVEPPLDAERAVCNANADDVHAISGGDDLGRIPP